MGSTDALNLGIDDPLQHFRSSRIEGALHELWYATAKAALASFDDQTETQTVYSPAPTIALSASGAVTTITNGIKVPFPRVDATTINTDGDPNFSHGGVAQGKQLVSSGDVTRGTLLTGGGAASARWIGRHSFWFTGQKFGIYVRTLANPLVIQVWVNGRPLSLSPSSNAVGVPERRHYEIDFGSVDTRLVEFRIHPNTAEINGVTIGPADSIRRMALRKRLAILGDSIAGGANGIGTEFVWGDRMAPRFGMDNWQLSIGGTGYGVTAGVSDYFTRIPDAVAAAPDILIVCGGQNDLGISQAAMTTLATTLFQALQAALPTTIILALGCHHVGEQISQNAQNIDLGVRAAAAACGIPFRSLIDPNNIYATTPNWTVSTSYLIGDVVRETTTFRNVLVCHTAHTSASSGLPDMTKIYAQSLFTGTGKVVTVTGRGNADVFIQADGIHPTALGHQALDGAISDFVAHSLRRIVDVG